jgi:hypothetical protein
MVLLEQLSSLSGAIDILLPVVIFAGMLWDMRNRVLKRAEKKAIDVEKAADEKAAKLKKEFDTYKEDTSKEMKELTKQVNDCQIEIGQLGGWKHRFER